MNKEKVKESLEYIFNEHRVIDNRTKSRILSKITTPPKKKKIIFMPIAVLICLLIGTGVWIATFISKNTQTAVTSEIQYEGTENPIQENVNETDKIAELEFEISQFEEEREYYHNIIDQIMPKLNEEEKLALAKSHFSYDITVNQHKLSTNGQMEVNPGDVDVFLTFGMTPHYNVLPEELYQMGMISGDYFSHITHVEPNNWEEIYADSKNITARGYKFKNMKSGTTIKITISDELKERLS